MLAGMTTSSYPQSIAVSTEMILTEPIQVHQEAEAIQEQKKPELSEKPSVPAQNQKVTEAPQISVAKKPSATDIGNASTKATVKK